MEFALWTHMECPGRSVKMLRKLFEVFVRWLYSITASALRLFASISLTCAVVKLHHCALLSDVYSFLLIPCSSHAALHYCVSTSPLCEYALRCVAVIIMLRLSIASEISRFWKICIFRVRLCCSTLEMTWKKSLYLPFRTAEIFALKLIIWFSISYMTNP